MVAREILAAGSVVFRPGREVLLVHRPKYDDWAFPKGKLDAGEHEAAAAVREVEEETGLRVRLMRPLRTQLYAVGRRSKRVFYWTGRAVDPEATDVSLYAPNDEIDEVAWVPFDKALRMLTYSHDRATLRAAIKQRKKTRTLVVLRHAEAWSRSGWYGDDRRRPLLVLGRRHADRVATVLDAYDVRRVVTSSSTRCVDTVAPFAERSGLPVEQHDVLTEEDATPQAVAALVRRLVADLSDAGGRAGHGVVVCSHRPVLPHVFAALGVRDPGLDKGAMLVVHLRKGEIVATELR